MAIPALCSRYFLQAHLTGFGLTPAPKETRRTKLLVVQIYHMYNENKHKFCNISTDSNRKADWEKKGLTNMEENVGNEVDIG